MNHGKNSYFEFRILGVKISGGKGLMEHIGRFQYLAALAITGMW